LEKLYVGLGVQDPVDPSKIVPVATFATAQGKVFSVKPSSKYFIASATLFQGEIIDLSQIKDPAEIDFTNNDFTSAKIIHSQKGYSTPKFGNRLPPSVIINNIHGTDGDQDPRPYMALPERGPLYASLTLSMKTKDTTQADADIIAHKLLAKIADGSDISKPDVNSLTTNRVNWNIIISFTLKSSAPKERLKTLAVIYKLIHVDVEFDPVELSNATLSYYEEDGILISQRVLDGTREYGALFEATLTSTKAGAAKRTAGKLVDLNAPTNGAHPDVIPTATPGS